MQIRYIPVPMRFTPQQYNWLIDQVYASKKTNKKLTMAGIVRTLIDDKLSKYE